MRRIQRQVLRAQGRMYRYGRYLRSWSPTIVGSEKNPSKPGAGWRSDSLRLFGLTGKRAARNKRASRRLERELIESGGAI